jgi:hypothetical protein
MDDTCKLLQGIRTTERILVLRRNKVIISAEVSSGVLLEGYIVS